MAKFVGDLRVKKIAGGRWELLEPLTYTLPGWEPITVPAGFDTDFSSVPRLPFMFWFLGDKADYAAVLHDYLYRTCEKTRAEADWAFRYVAEAEEELGWFTRWGAWFGLRIGGWSSYGARHKDNKGGSNEDPGSGSTGTGPDVWSSGGGGA